MLPDRLLPAPLALSSLPPQAASPTGSTAQAKVASIDLREITSRDSFVEWSAAASQRDAASLLPAREQNVKSPQNGEVEPSRPRPHRVSAPSARLAADGLVRCRLVLRRVPA